MVKSERMFFFLFAIPFSDPCIYFISVRSDWHFNYDQKKFMLMPPLEIIDAFETRRTAMKASPSDGPPDIMSVSFDLSGSISIIADNAL